MLTYGEASYGYSANGSLTYKIVGTDTTFYTYDLLGNLVSVLLPDDTFIEYIIDGQNRRVGKKVDNVFQKGWLYQDQLNPVVELDENGDPAIGFVYGTKGHVPDFMVTADEVSYRIITDHLGSVRLVVNAVTGAVVQRLEYDEFGNVIVDTNPGFQPFGYAGGLYDAQTGLVRFGARDYDAETGRWTAKDPLLFDSGDTQLYSYCFNNPVNSNDPSGLAYHRKNILGAIVGPVEVALTVERYGLTGVILAGYYARRAGDMSRATRLPGAHNGLMDAYRHCLWSCFMARTCGEAFAKNVTNYHEIQNIIDRQPACELNMDLHNNMEGRDAARMEGKCEDNCKEKLLSGSLRTITK